MHILSFDVEDWFHILDIPALEDVSSWAARPSIVENKTDLILSILDEYNISATFFMLGWIAERYPKLSRKIAEQGHEIASHAYWHRPVYSQTRQEFRQEIFRSKRLLEDQTGSKVSGFRAPSFSIVPGTEWAFEILLEAGFKYDASLFPAKRGHGGYPCDQARHTISTSLGEIVEVPMSVVRFGGLQLPFSGGGYLRALPLWLIKSGFDHFERSGTPVVVYLHPRDFATDQPVIPMPITRKFKSYIGLATTELKLRSLLENYKFGTCFDSLKASGFFDR